MLSLPQALNTIRLSRPLKSRQSMSVLRPWEEALLVCARKKGVVTGPVLEAELGVGHVLIVTFYARLRLASPPNSASKGRDQSHLLSRETHLSHSV